MTTQEVGSMIEGFGVPFAYYQFPENTEQAPPFLCFFYPNSTDFFADDVNYLSISELHIELYTGGKDFALEAKVEAALTAHNLPWYKEETYIAEEELHMTTWECSVVITNQEVTDNA